MFFLRKSRHHTLRSVMLLLALLPGFAYGDDSEPAAVRWSLLGAADTDSHDSEAAAVQFGCEKLRKKPPTSVNSETRIGRCGDAVSATANARNYRVSYTLLSHDRTLNHDTTTDSSFLIQRKAWCPSAAFPYLREDDSNRFRYSCWRCPSSELRPIPPRFVSEQVVRWFRSNQCPVDFDQTLTDTGSKIVTSKSRYQQKLPLATELTVADDATLRWLRDAPYGRLAELQLGSGERVFFIGDGVAGNPLTPANSKHGSLVERDGQWLWLTPQQTEYRFGASEEGFSKVSVKRGRDGKLWHYRWQRVGKAGANTTVLATLHRLDSLIDHSNQRYQFRYDQHGKLASLIMQAAGARERLAQLNNQTD